MNNGKYILKIIGYKTIPLMVTWFVALALLIRIKPLSFSGDIWSISITVGGLTIIVIAAYITRRIFNYYVEEEQPPQST